MKKRSIFLALGTALALVVLTAGLAFASGRWDGQHGSGPATGHRVTSGWTQPQALQAGASVQSQEQRTGVGCYGQTTVPGPAGRQYTNCSGRTSHQTYSNAGAAQRTRAASATGTRSATTSQPRQGSRTQWADRHRIRDGHCWDTRR